MNVKGQHPSLVHRPPDCKAHHVRASAIRRIDDGNVVDRGLEVFAIVGEEAVHPKGDGGGGMGGVRRPQLAGDNQGKGELRSRPVERPQVKPSEQATQRLDFS